MRRSDEEGQERSRGFRWRGSTIFSEVSFWRMGRRSGNAVPRGGERVFAWLEAEEGDGLEGFGW